jgi:hypothetical protein
LSESLSPTSPWGMPFEGADACGAGVAAGAGCLAGLATGAGAGLGAAAACDCFAAAGELGLLLLLLLLLLPPQLATPTAMSRIAAAVARKVIGLLRVIGSSVRNWDQGGSLPPGRLSSAGGRHICLQPGR